ncbi:hypothetical protein ACFQ6C_26490 [Streptomyces sp. NPDC056454]|uniref:hypothetical protein n=1 Tax=Streptomyces sp. NPDC056454 TaxID=3345823 RepID=UPI00367E2FAA
MTTGGAHSGGVPAPANSWVRIGKIHYFYRGIAPDGTARLVPMTTPPHGKTVHAYDATTATWSTHRLPSKLQPLTIAVLVLAALALVLIPLILSGQAPILTKVATPIAVGVLLLLAVLVQTAHLYPHDAISAAEAQQAIHAANVEAQHVAADRHAAQQAKNAQQAAQWAAATWAQTAQINQALHPGTDVYRPYGQSPPL